jgi:Domain of unknown function (DUF389)
LITTAYLLAALRNKKGLYSETQQVITDELSNLLGDRIPWYDAKSANLTCMKLERYLSTQDQFIDIVVIGAMLIAPLLGPNLAFGLGTALGDISLMRKSALTNSVGIILAVILSVVIGVFWPFDVSSPELAARAYIESSTFGIGFRAQKHARKSNLMTARPECVQSAYCFVTGKKQSLTTRLPFRTIISEPSQN